MMSRYLDIKVDSDPGSISLQNVWLPTFPLGAVIKGNGYGALWEWTWGFACAYL